MPKPFVIATSKKVKLKSGEVKVYRYWSLRVTVYLKEIGAVKNIYLRRLGTQPVMTEVQAWAIAYKYGKLYGFSEADLYHVKGLQIVPDEDEPEPNAKKKSRRKGRRAAG